MVQLSGLLLTVGLVSGASDADADRKELAQFEGVWSFALVEVEGARQPDAPYPAHRMIISRDGQYVVVQGERVTPGVLKVDPTKFPKHYDVAVTGGPGKGLTFSGIYEIEGDTYKICVPLRGGERPSDFASTPGSGRMLQVFIREKRDVKEALIEVARRELAGTWRPALDQRGEDKDRAEKGENVELSIDPVGKATHFRDGRAVDAGTMAIDPTANPMSLDLSYTEGNPIGQVALGIYKIEDGLLTICQAAPGQPRPSEFSSGPGAGHPLVTYKRVKAAAE